MDLQFLIFLFPAGVILCFRELRDEHVFVIIYALVGSYFAGVMVRLMLTLTPCVCVTAAIALSQVLDTYIDPVEPDAPEEVKEDDKKAKKVAAAAGPVSIVELVTGEGKDAKERKPGIFGVAPRLAVIAHTALMMFFFVLHCTWVTSNAYSSPSVVLASHQNDGMHLIDDFREAYYWLRQNTPETAVVMSWWDYGYQIAGMADRPTLVDNNTWNNSALSLPIDRILLANRPFVSPYCHGRKGDVEHRGGRVPDLAQA
jgi:dolichyl-diphosphooligosaccharide--protein glycosyltransferase